MNLSPTAIPWYSPAAYTEIVRLISPADKKAMTYDEWVEKMAQLEDDLRLVGRIPVRVDVEPEAVQAWCKEKNRPLDAEAIRDYTTDLMAEQRAAN